MTTEARLAELLEELYRLVQHNAAANRPTLIGTRHARRIEEALAAAGRPSK